MSTDIIFQQVVHGSLGEFFALDELVFSHVDVMIRDVGTWNTENWLEFRWEECT